MVTLSRSFEPDLNHLGSGDTLMLLRHPAHPTMLLTLLFLAVCCMTASSRPRTWKAPLGAHCVLAQMLAWEAAPWPLC